MKNQNKNLKSEVSNTNLKKFLAVLAICSLTPACSGMSYLDNKAVTEMREYYDLDSKKSDSGDYVPKQFGAFILPSASDNPDAAPHIIMLKREKTNYYAQSMISDNSEDNKALFKRTYLNFGVNSAEQGFSTELSFKF